jgi:hypothetical protein
MLKKAGINVNENAPDADVKEKFRDILCGDMPESKRQFLHGIMFGNVDFSAVELELDGLEDNDA